MCKGQPDTDDVADKTRLSAKKSSTCRKNFKQKVKSATRVHVITNKKHFKCDDCNKAFRHKYNLPLNTKYTQAKSPTNALLAINVSLRNVI